MTNKFYPAVVVELSEEDGGGFAAYAPDLYGCMGDGETPEEALMDLKSAIQEWIAEMVRLGRDVPEPGDAARSYVDERDELIEIIRQQGEALSRQSDQVNALKAELDGLHERVDRVVNAMGDRQRLASWTDSSPIPHGVATRVRAPAHH